MPMVPLWLSLRLFECEQSTTADDIVKSASSPCVEANALVGDNDWSADKAMVVTEHADSVTGGVNALVVACVDRTASRVVDSHNSCDVCPGATDAGDGLSEFHRALSDLPCSARFKSNVVGAFMGGSATVRVGPLVNARCPRIRLLIRPVILRLPQLLMSRKFVCRWVKLWRPLIC